MSRLVFAGFLAALAGAAASQESTKFYEVRQSYALPEADFVSFQIDACGAGVNLMLPEP